jgi:hypothetical protein
MLTGALDLLTNPSNWEKYGDLTPQECADYFAAIVDAYLQSDAMALIGVVVAWPSSTPPSWGLLCDGSVHDRADYPLLYDVLDDVYRVDGDTFITPDLRDLVVMGAGLATLGETGGNASVTLTVDQMPAHTHAYEIGVPSVINGGLEAPAAALVSSIPTVTGGTGAGESVDIRPPYHVLTYIIVAQQPGAPCEGDGGGDGGIDRVLYASTSEVTAISTTDSVEMFAATIPGGTLGDNGLLVIDVRFAYRNHTGNRRWLRTQLTYGSTVVFDCDLDVGDDTDTGTGTIRAMLKGDGAPDQQRLTGIIDGALLGSNLTYSATAGSEGISVEDSTGDLDLTLTAQPEESSAALWFTLRSVSIRTEKP